MGGRSGINISLTSIVRVEINKTVRHRIRVLSAIVWSICILLVSACNSGLSNGQKSTTEFAMAMPSPLTPLAESSAIETWTPKPEVSITLSPFLTPDGNQNLHVCSPLAGIALVDLETAVSNPFNPPPSGSDDPHQGVDLADMDANRLARAGMAVQSVLPGKIVMVTADRFPFGYAVIIETKVDRRESYMWDRINLPTAAPTPAFSSPLFCPKEAFKPNWDTRSKAVYILYAHLAEQSPLKSGESVECGSQIGNMGQSGNALAPHLHLEIRMGPSGTVFQNMAHYDNSATLEEMAAYCAWSVGGLFSALNPLGFIREASAK
jgi:murein DD-endopeptidase MepM/ murein hydrolase activator NlpD